MLRVLAVVVVVPCTSAALGDTATFSWNFHGAGDEITLTGSGASALIDVFLTVDDGLAGWHYDLNAEYVPTNGFPNFLLTDLWVMDEAERYGPTIPPDGDIGEYRSFADIGEQEPGVYYLPSGTYLIEQLTIDSTGMTSDDVISFDTTPLTGYNVLNPDHGFYSIVYLPGALIVHQRASAASGDYDDDGDVDLADFAGFQVCHTGDGQGPVATGCDVFDFDADDDVDSADLPPFVSWLTGPHADR